MNATVEQAVETGGLRMEVVYFAAICTSVTFSTGFFSQAAAQFLRTWLNHSFLTCLNVGVFSCLLFDHFWPDLDALQSQFKENYVPARLRGIHFAGPLICIGLIIIVIIDCYVKKAEKEVVDDLGTLESPEDDKKNNKVMMLLIVMALHSFLEGLPVGLEQDTFWATAGSMMIHKGIEATTVSIGLTGRDKMRAYGALAFYSSMTPLGAIVGGIVSVMHGPIADFVMMFLLGISVGLLLYILFIENAPVFLQSTDYKLITKFGIAGVSYGVVAAISVGSAQVLGSH